MDTLRTIKSKLTEARAVARREARREWDFPFLRDRERRLHVLDAKGERVSEPKEWRGTMREIRDAVSIPGAHTVAIEGGFDGHAIMDDPDYEPWVSSYSVDVWSAAGA